MSRRIFVGLIVLAWLAAVAPVSASAQGFDRIPAKPFKLKRAGLDRGSYRLVTQLQQRFPRAGIAAVIGDANRVTTPLQRKAPVQRLASQLTGGYGWNADDANTPGWVPQGITGSADANPRGIGVVAGHHVQAVSWHNRDDTAVRISFVDLDGRPPRYRHVLLVRPTGGGAFANLKAHAGGIAWVGHLMYMADDLGGVRVFDTKQIMSVPDGDGRRQQTANYRYLLPEVGRYRSVGARLNFSAVALDRAKLAPGLKGLARPSALVVGEYSRRPGGRIVRWKIGKRDRIVNGSAATAYRSPFVRLQGALTVRGTLIGSSSATSNGVLYTGRPGQPASARKWASGPEDLYYQAYSNELYSLTEYRKQRVVFGLNAGALGL